MLFPVMNLFNAIKQMRTGRKLGKISMETQQRVIRRLNPRPSDVAWEAKMRLRADIEIEIRPALLRRRESEYEVFQIRCDIPTRNTRSSKKIVVPIIAELTPEWWKESGKRERAAKKLARLAGMQDEDDDNSN